MVLFANLAGVKVGDGHPVRVMGAINVSPESFYKGSVRVTPEGAALEATDMRGEGAEIVDIGARSTAPYLITDISVQEEIHRLVPAIKAVKDAVDVTISADTKRSEVAEAALKAGADIINDVSGLKFDTKLAGVIADHGVPVTIMAFNLPRVGDPMSRISKALEESLATCKRNEVADDKIVVDPGIGFHRDTGWKWYDWDSHVLKNLASMREIGKPICVGVSRKSFIGEILGQKDPYERLFGSLSATAIAVLNGTHLIRTHDVEETLQAVKLAEYVRRRK